MVLRGKKKIPCTPFRPNVLINFWKYFFVGSSLPMGIYPALWNLFLIKNNDFHHLLDSLFLIGAAIIIPLIVQNENHPFIRMENKHLRGTFRGLVSVTCNSGSLVCISFTLIALSG